MAVPLLDGLHAQDLLSGLGQLAFFSVIYGFVTDQVAQFCVGLLVRMTAWVNGTALLLTTLWLIWQGYGLITGQDRTPATVRVTEAVRACVVVSVAGGLSLGGIPLFLWLGDGLLDAVTTIVTADPTPVAQRIDRSLATMQLVLASVEAIDTASSVDLHTDRDRAQWLVGAGIAGPAVVGGALLIMYRVGLALFVGFGPLFVLCLLFKPTRSLFWRWAEYGVGTMFAFAMLGVMVSLATRIVGAVAVALWVGHLAGAPDAGITSRAIQQGGVGLLMTTLIIAVPPMAAAFFRGVLGQFMAQSVFGGREQPVQPQSSAHTAGEVSPVSHEQARVRPGGLAQADEIKPWAPSDGDSFLARHPNALASNELMGGGDPLPASLQDILLHPAPSGAEPSPSSALPVEIEVLPPDTRPSIWVSIAPGSGFDPRHAEGETVLRQLTAADQAAIRHAQDRLQAHEVRPIYDPNDPHSYLLVVTRDGTGNDAEQMLSDTNPSILTNELLVRSDNVIPLYLPGVGTGDLIDQGVGKATAYGLRAGINAQLDALNRRVERIHHDDPQARVGVIYLGFSRGAFANRELANEARQQGLRIDQSAMMVYDTVGSVGIAGNNANLGYDSTVARDMQVLHLTANDEQRGLFPLTSIYASQDDRSNSNWLEIGLPGAHSDAGGSYNNEYSRIPLSMGHQYMQRLGAPMKPLGDYAPPALDDPDLKLFDSRYLPYTSPRAVYPATPLPTPDPDWKGSPRGL